MHWRSFQNYRPPFAFLLDTAHALHMGILSFPFVLDADDVWAIEFLLWRFEVPLLAVGYELLGNLFGVHGMKVFSRLKVVYGCEFCSSCFHDANSIQNAPLISCPTRSSRCARCMRWMPWSNSSASCFLSLPLVGVTKPVSRPL